MSSQIFFHSQNQIWEDNINKLPNITTTIFDTCLVRNMSNPLDSTYNYYNTEARLVNGTQVPKRNLKTRLTIEHPDLKEYFRRGNSLILQYKVEATVTVIDWGITLFSGNSSTILYLYNMADNYEDFQEYTVSSIRDTLILNYPFNALWNRLSDEKRGVWSDQAKNGELELNLTVGKTVRSNEVDITTGINIIRSKNSLTGLTLSGFIIASNPKTGESSVKMRCSRVMSIRG